VRQHLDDNSSIWSGNAPFVHASDMLTKAINSARSVLAAQAGTSAGISGNKDALENEAVRQAVAISRCAKIFAMDTANNELLAAVDYTKAKLLRLPQNELAARLRSMVSAAGEFSDALKEYGVPWEAYNRALEVIAGMENAQSTVRTNIKRRKAVTNGVPSIMSEGQEAMERMHHLIHIFEADYPAFVAEFKSIRDLVHVGIRHKDDESLPAA
jgi:hypothetical protein